MKLAAGLLLSALGLTVLGNAAYADVKNVGGISDRLESVECKGAYVLRFEKLKKLDEAGACQDLINDSAKYFACEKDLLKKNANFDPDAVFKIQAVAGGTDFRARIDSSGQKVFESVREATHGDTITDEISLIFFRKGLQPDDEFSINIERVNVSEDEAPFSVAFVPVKRRLLADLAYVFTEGCTEIWTEQD